MLNNMEELDDLLEINNLKIYQNRSWFSFSLDSVILASCITVPLRCKKILDLCTGNAPVPLILSTRTKAHIDGVEYQEDVANLAKKSVSYNKLDKQITIINDDINNYYKNIESDSYDLISCNPPYFSNLDNSEKNDDIHKRIARHEIKMELKDIFKVSKKLLKNNGTLALVHRTERLNEIIDLYREYNIEPKRIRFVHSRHNENAVLFLIEGTKNGKPGVKVLPPIFVYNENNEYTSTIKNIFNKGVLNDSKEL